MSSSEEQLFCISSSGAGAMTQSLLCALLQWISSYEQWVQQIHGRGYREQCLDRNNEACGIFTTERELVFWQRDEREDSLSLQTAMRQTRLEA